MKPIITALLLVLVAMTIRADDGKPSDLIDYTEGRNDLREGQFANWVTHRACVVKADGTNRKVLAEKLTRKPHTWTQFAGWSPVHHGFRPLTPQVPNGPTR